MVSRWLAEGETLLEYKELTRRVNSVAFNSDGQRLATGSEGSEARGPGGDLMSIRRRLERLEAGGAASGCGLECPPHAVVLYCQDGFDGESTLDEGQRPPATCRRCGRPARALEMVVVYDPDFYGNVDRLPAATPGT